jgi:hypothetical protein
MRTKRLGYSRGNPNKPWNSTPTFQSKRRAFNFGLMVRGPSYRPNLPRNLRQRAAGLSAVHRKKEEELKLAEF